MTSEGDAPVYRPCVGIALFNRQGLVFAGRRIHGGNERTPVGFEWQMPQGGIDAGEDPLPAAKRELFEETNVRSVRLLAEAPDWLTYDIPGALLGSEWRGRYRGQTQKWFAFRFEGDESEIDIAGPGGNEPEFQAWAWMPLRDMPNLVVPFKKAVYEKVVATFSSLGDGS